MMLRQSDTFRRLGLGDFRTLCQALVADPALIYWLDGQTNRAGRPMRTSGGNCSSCS